MTGTVHVEIHICGAAGDHFARSFFIFKTTVDYLVVLVL